MADLRTRLFLSAVVTRGPGHDAGPFREAVGGGVARCPLDALPGDAAFGAEPLRESARNDLGIRSTVSPACRRGGGSGPVRGKDRGQTARHFRPRPEGARRGKRVYGQRWQVERAFSRHQRLLGSALRAKLWPNQEAEVLLRVIVHNLMILAAQ